MNKHTKIAIFIAPFLLVGGYIAADYYAMEKSKQKNLFKLNLQKQCDLSITSCLLSNKQLELSLSHFQGISYIKSSHSLDSVVFSVVDKVNNETTYTLIANSDKKIWQSPTQLSSLLESNPKLTLRVIASVNKAYYYSEFATQKD